MEQKYQVSQNILYNFLGQFILLAVGVVSAPFIIHKLGNDLYGIYAILTVVIGYFSILDLGLGAAIIKFISEYSAQDDQKSLEKIIGNALTAYIIVGAVGGLLIVLFTKIIVLQFLHIPSDFIPMALSAFYISALGFFVTMILTVFNAIPSGLQRMDITNSRNVVFGLLNTFGVIGLLLLGQSLMAIVIWNILTGVVATLVFITVILKLLPNISLKPQFDLMIFKKLLNFGGFKFVSNIAGQIVFQLDRLLIGLFQPIAAVTFYTAPLLLVQKGFTALLNITSAVFPAISFSASLNDQDRIKELYIRMNRLIIFIISPVLAILFLFASQILQLWLGSEFSIQSSAILKILSLAYFFIAVSASAVIVSEGAGKPQIPAIFATISALINLVAALILIPQVGAVGAAWALLINVVLQVPVFVFVVNKKVVKISNLIYFKESFLKPLCGLFTSIIISFIVSSVLGASLLGLTASISAFVGSYLLANLLLNTFSEKDKVAFFYLLKKIKLRIT